MTHYTALPGLLDVHTHMTFVPTSMLAALTQAGRSAATAYLSQNAAKRTLETGVATVRNLNAQNYKDIARLDRVLPSTAKAKILLHNRSHSASTGIPVFVLADRLRGINAWVGSTLSQSAAPIRSSAAMGIKGTL